LLPSKPPFPFFYFNFNKIKKIKKSAGVLYLNLFLLSTELLKTASEDNMLTLEQLLKMKNDHKSSSFFLNSYNKTKARPIHLIHTVKPELSKKCRSLTDASLYIKEIDGTSDRMAMRRILILFLKKKALEGELYKGH
jgi:hypothetical protein